MSSSTMSSSTHCAGGVCLRESELRVPGPGVWQMIRQLLQTSWTWLMHPPELRVWRCRDRSGNIYWRAYNPANGQSFSSGSETEIRYWIAGSLR
uniref:Uncharacterized protein n=1 Tax=Cyanothece sp. (strain PCC 7425 / ATCC 29141) TaxID=395961 RepID=B8HL44_CYAP4